MLLEQLVLEQYNRLGPEQLERHVLEHLDVGHVVQLASLVHRILVAQVLLLGVSVPPLVVQ